MAASNSNGTTLIVDSSKNWVPGEHVGRLVHLCVAGTAPTAQVRWITANTATTLTVATITQGVIGTSKYCIYDAKSYGTDDQFKQANKASYGHCTGGSSTTTLVDTTKDWTVNQWAGYLFKIEAGTGFGSGRISIISNTATTLTFAAQTFTPDATSHYEIADSWGLISTGGTTTHTEATSKNWVVNQWSGKRFRVTAGAGLNQEATVVTNTATQITTATLTTTDNTSAYCIYGCPVKGAGFQLIHIFGTTNTSQNGRIMFLPRGASSNTADIYDIPKDRWVYGYLFTPQQELQGTGTKYAYDGVNTVYFSKAVLGANARIFAYNLLTNDIKCVGTAPYNDSTLIIGNRMEIIQTADGLKYLYIMRDSGAEMFRMLTFF
jgi:hypothetical protein